MKYYKISELSNIWNIKERTIRNYCFQGKIEGAILKGKTWLIPENASIPSKKVRVKTNLSLLEILKEQKERKLKGSFYHKLQIVMTYNSNHMEGSKLTFDQTRFIFETNTITSDSKVTNVDDVLETINHFNCIDYVIDVSKKKLSETIIKNIHKLLKTNTSDSKLSWFNVGEYKALENEIANHETTPASKVKQELKDLLYAYNQIEKVTIEDIIDFHYKFERIHPFQDGNGRVGRLIILKECLKNNIVPVLIEDEDKYFYYRGLENYKDDKQYLIDTCLHGQDKIKAMLDYFKINY